MHKVPLEGGLFAMNLTSASGATRLTKTEHTESLSETGEMWCNSSMLQTLSVHIILYRPRQTHLAQLKLYHYPRKAALQFEDA
jgi:hypothetical protein